MNCAFIHCCMSVCLCALLVVNSVGCPEGVVGSRSLVRMSSCLTRPTGTGNPQGVRSLTPASLIEMQYDGYNDGYYEEL